MKLIIFERDPVKASQLNRQLRVAGHQVVAWAKQSARLQDLIGEFHARCVVAQELPDRAWPCPMAAGACAPGLTEQMLQRGFRIQTGSRHWEAALKMCHPAAPHEQLVERAASASVAS